jgi:hypothetical protein
MIQTTSTYAHDHVFYLPESNQSDLTPDRIGRLVGCIEEE